jgi:hypothetical protein
VKEASPRPQSQAPLLRRLPLRWAGGEGSDDACGVKALLQEAEPVEDEEAVFLSPGDLRLLSVEDIPEGVRIEVGVERAGTRYIDWDGELEVEGGSLLAHVRYSETQKYWDSPLGLAHFIDLVRRAVEVRERTAGDAGDVKVGGFDDDGAWLHFDYMVELTERNLHEGYSKALAVKTELEEAAAYVANETGKLAAAAAERLSGWGDKPLDELIAVVDKSKSNDEKGRALEELVAKLFVSVDGFTVTDRVRTQTEEIDLTILNASKDPRFAREAAIILVECKNWSSKCGKNEFVAFREKLLNRRDRSTLGFLVSLNGFAGTVTKEMLRGSRERTLVVPVTGEQVRRAVRENAFPAELGRAWDAAVLV